MQAAPHELKDTIFKANEANFGQLALQVFRFQAANVAIYADYLRLLKVNTGEVSKVEDIPFLPVQMFKSHKVIAEGLQAEMIFESSGTGGRVSRHYVAKAGLYDRSLLEGFRNFYGNPRDYIFLALLPSYLERSGSSLVYMFRKLMEHSGNPSGFFLDDFDELNRTIKRHSDSGKKIFLVGVAFALLDFARRYNPDLSSAVVMETGGMKGRKREISRDELHQELLENMNVKTIHSEYGMTELLSQAYSSGAGIFKTQPWMKIMIRETNDPFSFMTAGHAGAINIIDLANLYSCSFIALEDLGRLHTDGSFEVLGRMDTAEIRGCSLMYY